MLAGKRAAEGGGPYRGTTRKQTVGAAPLGGPAPG